MKHVLLKCSFMKLENGPPGHHHVPARARREPWWQFSASSFCLFLSIDICRRKLLRKPTSTMTPDWCVGGKTAHVVHNGARATSASTLAMEALQE